MDLQRFRRNASRNKKKLTAFLQKLDEIVPVDFHEVVEEADKTVWSETDCLACANCCKTMTPTYTKADITRISAHLGMKRSEFVKRWLHKEEETGDMINNSTPCQFLGDDNKCTIYAVRPRDCAEFPHHQKRPFDLYNDTFINNLHRCPATFRIISIIRKKVEKEYEW